MSNNQHLPHRQYYFHFLKSYRRGHIMDWKIFHPSPLENIHPPVDSSIGIPAIANKAWYICHVLKGEFPDPSHTNSLFRYGDLMPVDKEEELPNRSPCFVWCTFYWRFSTSPHWHSFLCNHTEDIWTFPDLRASVG